MKKILLSFFLVVFYLGTAMAHSRTISGRVISGDDQLGIPGASIVVKGTSQGTMTDLDGSYSITVSESASTLLFSFVGFVTKEVYIGTTLEINVTLCQTD
ncbi:carboxypeptidase-like regulatory domain-containing protein [uncultured Algoriphagus sp.]|uniref:carboxypeptidase-like regulatory domain-containing protein n=1 Tax=uncultured Algoriphagus sp. TaxID=417365 RepID=UPI0030EEE663|tara:strand:+ start:5930 stop:6229 length:300 start_codon:yes stop_codon:yes gene_type:complete